MANATAPPEAARQDASARLANAIPVRNAPPNASAPPKKTAQRTAPNLASAVHEVRRP